MTIVYQEVNEIAQSMSFYNRLTKYKKLEYLINSDDPQKSKITKYESRMRVRDRVLELNAMYNTECFYYVERKLKKVKERSKVKDIDENEDDMNSDQEDDIKVDEEPVKLKNDGKIKEKSKTYRNI